MGALETLDQDMATYVDKAYWTQARNELRRQVGTLRFDMNNLVSDKGGDKAAANAAVKQIVAMTKLTKVAPLGTKDNPFPGGVSFSSLSGTTGTPGSW